MNQELSRLYQTICDYSPDDGESEFTFTQRLARDNGWDIKYAGRVVREYKKFMFLAVAAGHPVTPSEEVDQAWHLHLIYTRSYWDDFCGRVLGKPIHHGPTKGGSHEQAKFLDLYEQTKASYARMLNESPPPDIWPDSARRFGDDVHSVRINTRDNWVIPKRNVQHFTMVAAAALFLVAVITYGFRGSSQIHPDRPSSLIRSAVWNTANPLPVPVRYRERNLSLASTMTPQQRDASTLILTGLAIGVIVVVCIAIAALFNGKCSACGRLRAMKTTGNKQRGTGWFAANKEEWKCNHCGATTWVTCYACCGGGGSGSGCGGATHCGDSGCAASGCGGGGCGGGGCGGGGCGG
jgi:hypothetical protein